MNFDHTEPVHQASPTPILIQASTSQAIHPELVPRSISPRTDTSNPSPVLSSPSVPTQATTTRAIHPELVRRSTSPRTDTSNPSPVLSSPSVPTKATTTRAIHPELVRRSTSPRIDTSNPSTVSSSTPLRPIPAATRDVTETSQNRLSTRPLPVLPNETVPQDIRMSLPRITDQARSITLERRGSLGPRSAIDWIVPLDDKPMREKTVGERLDPTLRTAIDLKNKFASKATWIGYGLNIAIGLQVVLGSLTTGLSIITTGRQTSIMTAILGGLATIVASYLARMRGSNEPELSNTRVKDLDQFVRECEAFRMDRGHQLGSRYDHELENFRLRFEELLGNINGERRSNPPA